MLARSALKPACSMYRERSSYNRRGALHLGRCSVRCIRSACNRSARRASYCSAGLQVSREAASFPSPIDLEENIRFANVASASMQRQIDEYIAGAGIDAPPAKPGPAETVAPRLPNPPIRSLDFRECGITTVIWCTGFQGNFRWVHLPNVLDARGQPVHEDGVTSLTGLYFAGLDFASTRKSGTLLAVAGESRRLVEYIIGKGFGVG